MYSLVIAALQWGRWKLRLDSQEEDTKQQQEKLERRKAKSERLAELDARLDEIDLLRQETRALEEEWLKSRRRQPLIGDPTIVTASNIHTEDQKNTTTVYDQAKPTLFKPAVMPISKEAIPIASLSDPLSHKQQDEYYNLFSQFDF